MNSKAVLHLFDKLTVWSRGDQRTPHKPLLILYALGRGSRGEKADVSFKQVYVDVVPVPAYPPRLNRLIQSWQALGTIADHRVN